MARRTAAAQTMLYLQEAEGGEKEFDPTKVGSKATTYYTEIFGDDGADDQERHRAQRAISAEYDSS